MSDSAAPTWIGCFKKTLFWARKLYIWILLSHRPKKHVWIFFSRTSFWPPHGASKSANIVKYGIFSLGFLWCYIQNLRNEKPVVTIYSILLYDKYFVSNREISVVFDKFSLREKWSTWLQSAFHSANFEYNNIKIRENFFSHILQYWPISTPRGEVKNSSEKKNISHMFFWAYETTESKLIAF